MSQVDSPYEYCKWINPQQQECDFEWKRVKGNITTQECHGAFKEKVVAFSVNIATIAIENITTHNENFVVLLFNKTSKSLPNVTILSRETGKIP